MSHSCHDCEMPADPEYDQDFTDVQDGRVLHFCKEHGEITRVMLAALDEAFKTRPGFAEELAAEIDRVKMGDA